MYFRLGVWRGVAWCDVPMAWRGNHERHHDRRDGDAPPPTPMTVILLQ